MKELASLESEVQSLAPMTTDELRGELHKAIEVTVSQVRRIAAIIRVLEDRGESLDDLRSLVFGFIRRVAYGQTLPEIVVRFQGHPLLLSKVASLPLPDQTYIAAERPIAIVEMRDGEAVKREVRAELLTRDEVAQVFTANGIRTLEEQEEWLRSKLPGRRSSQTAPVKIDRARRGIVVRGEFISRAALAKLLAELNEE